MSTPPSARQSLNPPRRGPWRGGLLALLLLPLGGPALADAVSQVRGFAKAGLLVQEGGQAVVSHNPDIVLAPASTMKVLTALAAISTWGRDYHFETEFYQDGQGTLWVKGRADPYLVSEELDRVAAGLKAAGVTRVAGIGLDDTYFDQDVEIAGRSATDNPYDAPVTALAANFNTVNLVKSGASVASAEPQTPLTDTARRFGQLGGAGTQRVNLKQRPTAVGYFGELLAAKLAANGIAVSGGQRLGAVPSGARLVYRHKNSRTLADMLVPTLKYSNNFVANSLFLRMADPQGKGRVSVAGAQRAMTEFARGKFHWTGFKIEDGAGLSRGNRLSARQLVEVMQAFAPNRDLMPTQEGNANIRAKTGTLTGVSAYAGYVRRGGAWEPFALLINQPVDAGLRRRVAAELVR
ncbi:D-alanyl-D-alanine carboxypeptidase [uncultured Thiodictyon sp.]|jgi:D-alanyl-D-alanine carboxypeptidase/D-alanyl-D-alanine-endopeptidase (penicillin-binding protein 4)|uniref:D-alanyl-D-alanine carboxypeptidase/D-alanyl-D-alanine-endopeptidase n=1 Tax=uncultured Thiodictyon sp. TaxID=1846217 RepID=UPI0025CC3CAD|nr:D-alanyl-D-alanine carboxypeptidase [uncultured Thiodictyon sp.]